MRTALVLLLLLALASIAGSLVPQSGVSDPRIAAMFREHPLRAELYRKIGLFDVYGSWWFTLIYALLLVSLGACLLPRTRALIRNALAKPQPARELDSMRHYAERSVAADPTRAIARARKVLRRRFFRVNETNGAEPAIAADKGLAREGGSLLFHWAFFLILVGIVIGKGTGFTGTAVIVEGETWTEAHANYDGNIREGSFFGEAHTGVQVSVDDFNVTYRADGTPAEFLTRVQLIEPDGRVAKTADIRVNHPASIDGVHFYQFGYGWAPVIEVRKDGVPIASGPVVFQQTPAPVPGVDRRALPWQGVVKLPSLRPQVGIQFQLWPDARALESFIETGKSFPMLEERNPVLTYTAYEGDLRLSTTQRANELDRAGLRQIAKGAVGKARTSKLPNGITVSFPDLREYTVLQVSRDRGLLIMLSAAVLILAGLIPALYSSRRKLWVQAEPSETGSLLKVGGFALQRRVQFEEEFERLVDELAGERQRKR